MKIQWLGHASFLITSENGTKIITDPYEPILGMNYGEIKESADVVTVSHEHGDHNNVATVQGSPQIITSSAPVEAAGITFTGIDTFHDASGGSERGTNIIFCFEVDGVKVCHFGDLGHMLTDAQAKAVGKPDVIMIPVGGNFTIDAATADAVIDAVKPAVVIPMHYSNDRCPEFPVAGVAGFIEDKENVTEADGSEVEYTPDTIPGNTQVVVLKPAL
ncbi:MAG: MBL fold metallo-hydrolase [Dehalococcoidales bacterium]|nr:MBL fold metallo-hydrolase [Dehalococcoidales bacterium]